MKYLLGLFLLIPCVASAQQGIQNVHEVAIGTNTIVQTVDVDSQTPTDVAATTSSGTVGGYFAIEVFTRRLTRTRSIAASTSAFLPRSLIHGMAARLRPGLVSIGP